MICAMYYDDLLDWVDALLPMDSFRSYDKLYNLPRCNILNRTCSTSCILATKSRRPSPTPKSTTNTPSCPPEKYYNSPTPTSPSLLHHKRPASTSKSTCRTTTIAESASASLPQPQPTAKTRVTAKKEIYSCNLSSRN